MAQPVTTPADWRRRAALADAAGDVDPPPAAGELGRWAREGLAALKAGDDAGAAHAAERCRAIVWDQAHDRPGLRIGPDQFVLAHAGPQRFDALGDAAAFLARSFEERGDDDDLAAAVELHDLTVALGDEVWTSPANASVGLAAAVLYEITGEHAFLATAERVADMLCEAQGPDGSWGRGAWVDRQAAAALAGSADAVEARAPLEEGEEGGQGVVAE
jgi:hypothetical protein